MISVAAISRNLTRSLLVATLAALAIGVAGCGKGSKTVDEYLQDAQGHRLSGNLSAAVLDLKNALQQNPDNSAARYMLGEIYIDIGDGASAEKELTRAKELGMDPQSLTLPLARSWLLQRQYRQVLDDLPLPETGDTQKLAVLNLHGQALLGLGDFDQAEAAFKQAQALTADSVEAVIGLARVAMARGNLDDAQAFQTQAEELSPQGIESLRLKADLDFLKKDYEKASAVYAQLVKQRPQSLVFRLAQSWAQVGAKQLDDAAESLDTILRATPNNVPANYLRGVVYYDQKKYEDANNSLERVLNQNSSYPPGLLMAGATNYALKHYEQAANYLSRLVSMAPKFEPALKLLALTQMQLGQTEAAAVTLKPLMVDPDKIEDEQTLRLVAVAALQSGDLQSGKNYIEKAVERAPDDTALRAQLGLTRISLGETDAGLDDLEAAAKEAPDAGPKVMLGYNQLKAGKLDDALATAKSLQESQPKDSTGFVLEGLVHDKQGDQDAAKASFAKALEVNPAAVDAVHNMAVIEARNNRVDAARAIYSDFLKKNPDSIPILVDAAKLEARLGNAPKVEEILQHLIELQPDNASFRVSMARIYLTQGHPDKSIRLLEEILQDHREDPVLLEVLGLAQLRTGRAAQAADTFGQLARIRPSASMAHYWLANAREQSGDLAGAKAAVNRSLSLQSDNLAAQMLKGDIAVKAGDAASLEASIQALSGNAAVEKSPAYKDLLAAQALSQGKLQAAFKIIEEVNKEAPNSERTSRLAALEVRMGDAAGAAQRLEAWVKDRPEDKALRLQLGTVYRNDGDLASAARVLTALVKSDPQFWQGQNDLAWVLYRQDKRKEALEHIEAALKLAPDNLAVLDTYGNILLETGDASKAIVYLERVVQTEPRLTSSQVALAKAYAAVDQDDKATQLLRKLLSDGKAFPERTEAEALLAQLQSKK